MKRFRAFHSSHIFLFPRPPRLPLSPLPDNILPNDFDLIAERALAPLYPSTVSHDNKSGELSKKLGKQLKTFEGPNDTLVDLDSRKEFKAGVEVEAKREKYEEKKQRKKNANLMPKDINIPNLDDATEKPAKPNMDHLYDSRHEFDPDTEPAEKIDTVWFKDKVYNAPEGLIDARIAKQPRWMRAQTDLLAKTTAGEQESATGPLNLEEILEQLEEFAAFNVNVVDARTKVDHVDYVIICEGRSQRHVYSIADSIRRLAKHRYTPGAFMPATLAIEGKEHEDWLVLDLGRFMVHCFTPEARKETDLDGMWDEEMVREESKYSGLSTKDNLRNTMSKHIKKPNLS